MFQRVVDAAGRGKGVDMIRDRIHIPVVADCVGQQEALNIEPVDDEDSFISYFIGEHSTYNAINVQP